MVNENELKQMLQELEILKNQMEMNVKTSEQMQTALEEKERANEALETILKMDDETPIMMPIGDDTFLSLKIANKESAVTSIGTRLWVRMDISKILERNKNDLDTMKKDLRDLNERSTNIEKKVRELNMTVQREYLALQQQAAAEATDKE